MKILYVCAVYPPEREPAGGMAARIAGRLTQVGHQVTVVCSFPNRPGGTLYPGYHRRLRQVERHGGVKVVRSPGWLVGRKRRPWSRILENVTFGLSSALNAWREGRPDLVVLETWPLFAVHMLLILASIWRVPVLNYVQDVYPESLERSGLIKTGGVVARLLLAWDRHLCLRSSRLIVISEGMRKLMSSSRPGVTGRVAVVHNFSDQGVSSCTADGRAWRDKHGIPAGSFLALYAGTLGFTSGADVLVDAALFLREAPRALIVCVGEGVLKDAMVLRSAELALTNIRFLPFEPREAVEQMHAAADAFLLTTRAGLVDTSVPSKLMTYLAGGRPLVCSVAESSEPARVLRQSRAGILVPPGSGAQIAAALQVLADSPEAAAEMGRDARTYFEDNFTFDHAFTRISGLVDQAAGTGERRLVEVRS